MEKLTAEYQLKWSDNHLYHPDALKDIGQSVKLHTEIENVLSSAASCINVLANIGKKSSDLLTFLNSFDLQVQEIIPFPTDSDVGGEIYDDKGNVIFEWIGPKKSTIGEKGGGRGWLRTSIDAFVLAIINNQVTQILIEWKFTEKYETPSHLQKFGGIAGNERLRRYSSVLARLRKKDDIPFRMEYEDNWGIYDLGYEPLYQLLRMTLLAKTTSTLHIGDDLLVTDYRILHLSHSKNSKLNIVSKEHLKYSPGLVQFTGLSLHDLWMKCLSGDDVERFKSGFWNDYFGDLSDLDLLGYLQERYG